MSDIDRVKSWFSREWREVPWAWGIILANVATWMLAFFGINRPAELIYGPLGLEAAWRWILYPFYTPLPIHWLALSLYVFYLFASALERLWGSAKFGRVFVSTTLITAVMFYLGYAAVEQTTTPTAVLPKGLIHVELTLFVIWAALNSGSSVLAFFVIPVQAWWLAAAFVLFEYFDTGRILGLFAVATPIAGWFWAKRDALYGNRPTKGIGERFKERKRAAQKKQFKVLPGKGIEVAQDRVEAPNLRAVKRADDARKRSVDQAELDRILDKIRFEGMESLSPAEKETLDSHSKKLNEQS